MKKSFKLTFSYIAVILAIVLLLIWGGSARTTHTAASERSASYTDVMEDLKKDSNFDEHSFDAGGSNRTEEYKVIHIAESVDNELFIYTACAYGTIGNLTSINISTEIGDNLSYRNYTLTKLSSKAYFSKYLVDGFAVKSNSVRYYNISSIYRPWSDLHDEPTDNDNTISEVAIRVGQQWTVTTENGEASYSFTDIDVVEIINPFVDYLSYGQQSGWDFLFGVTQWTDIHYIAFTPDRKIDTLKEADVTYTTQSYHYNGRNDEGFTYGEKSEPQYITLTGKEQFGVDGYEKYTWDSIYRTEDFIEKTDLNRATAAIVEQSEFVLVFLKTPFKEQDEWSMMQGHYKILDGVKVADVSILRLNFETDGISYNLGTVMNKQAGDDKAGNEPDPVEENPTEESDWIDWLCRLIFGKNSKLDRWVQRLIVIAGLVVIGIVILFTSPL